METNEKQYSIYLRSINERIPCSKEEFEKYFHDISLFRQKQQYHGRCVCPKAKWMECDMDCQVCPFYRSGELSLDSTSTDENGNEHLWHENTADPAIDVYADLEKKDLISHLHILLSDLSPEEKEICTTIMSDLSERAAAAKLGITRKAYVCRRAKLLAQLKKELKNFI